MTRVTGGEGDKQPQDSPVRPEHAALLSQLRAILSTGGVKAYIVGGFVRQLLLGKEPADIDIAVEASGLETAQQVAHRLKGRLVILDRARDTARVVVPPSQASGLPAPYFFDFTGVKGGLQRELSRRDFTINAIAIPLDSWENGLQFPMFIDPVGGRKDLEDRCIRAVSPNVFDDDPARLLRAARLAAELGFRVERETERLVQSHASLISRVAGERIREEFLRLLKVPESAKFLRYLDYLGLLTVILPELAATKGVEQPREHQWDVFNHSLETVACIGYLLRDGEWRYATKELLSSVPWSGASESYFSQEITPGSDRKTLLKLAGLLHDVAKPQTKKPDEKGKIRFLGHAKEGAEVAGKAMERLRFSSRERKAVEVTILYHLRPGQMANDGLPTPRAIYRYFRDTADSGVAILFLGLADHLATRGEGLELTGWREHTHLVEFVLGQQEQEVAVVTPPKLLDGHDLMEVFHLNPGPELGRLLEAVREAQAAGELHTKEEAIALVKRLLSSAIRRSEWETKIC